MQPDLDAVSTTADVPMHRLRTWPALLALLFLSPAVGELISGSTPPLLFVQPFALVVLPTLYGISAVLIHEALVRRRLGWGNALLLGAAFGIFQEALIVQTWFTFLVPDSPSHDASQYGVLWGTDWVWALNLSFYHAVISITVPLILLGLLFPKRSGLPWLGRKGTLLLTVWMLLLMGALAFNVAFKQFAAAGYGGPPLGAYLACAGLLVLTILLGVAIRFPSLRPRLRHAPHLWTVRLSLFGMLVFYFVVISILLPHTPLPAPLTMFAGIAVFAVALWRVSSWSARAGWNERHWLAVCTGIVMYFAFFWAPLIEFVDHLPQREGLTVTDIAVFVALLLFDQRLKRRVAATPSADSGEAAPVPPAQSVAITQDATP
ncbi:MAG TPA: hypothetical protein VF120_14855 [Ktedonobacterales bacterium]